tara:strand:+ start:25 stop:465 length:441 start_codon:yes stop_codon:yes gene_type:complete
MLNQVNLIGSIKSQPQERGAAISFRMTTWRTHYDGRRFNTTHTVEVFGKSKEAASKLKEGDMVIVQGSVKHSSYEKNGQKVFFTSINAFSVAPLSSEEGVQSNQTRESSAPRSNGSAPESYPPPTSGESPSKEVKSYPGFDSEYGF